jgi:dipeptidyl aminopeptidase/acylaminoacyl peptidase
VTDLNPHLDGVAEGTWHRFTYRTVHGFEHGALTLTPPGWRAGTPSPTVVEIYPGHSPSRNLGGIGPMVDHELLAAHGYAALLADSPYDPRAAADPIEAAPAAVLPAVDEAVRLGFSDPARLAATRSSHGGTAVLGLLTRTGRFRAAIAEAGIADMVSKYGQMHLALHHPKRMGTVFWCETGQGGMGGPPWERPLRYLANPPIHFIDRVTTPMLLVAGTNDTAVSWTQCGEVFVGPRRLGRSCTLLVGRGEGHGAARWSEANRPEAVGRMLAWLARHLQAR